MFYVPWGGLCGVLSSLECRQESKKNFRKKVDTEVSPDGRVPACQGDSLQQGCSGQSIQWAKCGTQEEAESQAGHMSWRGE